MRKVQIMSNGLRLAGIVNEADVARSPLVIMLHGNTGWKEEEHLNTLAAELATSGIFTLRFDAPGLGESDGTWSDDYRVTNYINAVKDAHDWAVDNLNIDRGRVGVWSHSMGGLVAAQAAVKWPDMFKALCGSQPSTGVSATSSSWKKEGGLWRDTEKFGKVWLPKDFFIDREQYDTAEAAQQLSIPQLYIAGTKDELAPLSAVELIYKKAGEPKTFMEFPTDHFYKNDPKMLKEINKATVDFYVNILTK